MDWISDVTVGDWLLPLLDDDATEGASVQSVAPRGFAAYAQILHPGGELGGMPSELLSAIARVLSAHTTTPEGGYIALWDGLIGLVGFLGQTPSRVLFQASGDADDAAALDWHNRMLGASFTDRFNNVFRENTWQDGILSREISDGPRLHLSGRSHVLFRGGIAELTDPAWERDAPWRDRVGEESGFEPFAYTPSLIWPDDHAWAMVTDAEQDASIVGGSSALIAALVADPMLATTEVPAP